MKMIKKKLFGIIKRVTTDKYKKYYLFGIQIMKKDNIKHHITQLQTELNLLKKKKTINNIPLMNADIIEEIWIDQRTDEELFHWLKLNIATEKYECISHRNYLIYISMLIEKKEILTAVIELKKYVQYYGTKDVFRYPEVAVLALQENIKDEQIEKSALIWDILNDKNRNDVFKKYIQGKKIAIVGNSGSEIGKGRGTEIDAHDIVIRCNNYPSDDKYYKDYGRKTNIWVRNSAVTCKNREDIFHFDYVIWKDDFAHFPIRLNYLDIMYNYISNYPDKLLYINKYYYQTLLKESGISHPTSGGIMIWMLYKILGNFDNIDIYGFSFLSKDYNDNGHYYDDIKFSGHHIDIERDFLYKLYSKSIS